MFIYVMKFLQEVLKQKTLNGTDVDLLTIVFSKVLIGGYVEDEKDPVKGAEQEVLVSMIRFLLSSSETSEEKSVTPVESESE